jgi:transcriptional regulator with XRE-family HTH domain
MVDANGGQIDLEHRASAGAEAELRIVLRLLRRGKGLSQRDLTTPLSLAAHSAIVDYESGRRIPSPNILAAYERYFELPRGSLERLRGRALAERAAAEARQALDATADIRREDTGIPRRAGLPLGQLPPDARDFTGRDAELRDAFRAVRTARVAALTVSGPPGVGKTAFAVRLAHLLKGRFPDGQLFACLRGPQGRKLAPGTVIGRFLRALGVPANELPANLDERSCLLRSILARTRSLLVLDNAVSESQVRPLLPAASGCLTLITSRSVLSGLEGAKNLILDVPSAEDALELLGRVTGDSRPAAEEAFARHVVRLCAHLPLAIRITGARLAARPAWTVAELARRLGDEQRRLGELATGDLEIRAHFELSYAPLAPAAQRVFRRLGLITVASFSIGHAAALAALSPADTQSILECLTDVSLVQAIGPGQYRMHDLLRLYAAERSYAEDDFRARQDAIARLARAMSQAERADGSGTAPDAPGTAVGGALRRR